MKRELSRLWAKAKLRWLRWRPGHAPVMDMLMEPAVYRARAISFSGRVRETVKGHDGVTRITNFEPLSISMVPAASVPEEYRLRVPTPTLEDFQVDGFPILDVIERAAFRDAMTRERQMLHLAAVFMEKQVLEELLITRQDLVMSNSAGITVEPQPDGGVLITRHKP